MNYLSLISAVAACVTAVAATAVIFQIRQGKRHMRFDVYQRVVEMMEKTGRTRTHLREVVKAEAPLQDWLELTPRNFERFRGLVRTYDELGLIVKHGVVPLRFLLDLYSRPIVEAWHRLEPAMMKEGAGRPQCGHRRKFAILAMAAKAHRDEFHGVEKEETFEVKAGHIERWKDVRSEWPREVKKCIDRSLRGKCVRDPGVIHANTAQ